MKIKVRCTKCGEYYVCSQTTTSLVGPVLETTCTECGHKLQQNYSAFLFGQIEGPAVHSIERACKMIALSHTISKVVSNEEAFSRKK
jgi:hypothetical protein